MSGIRKLWDEPLCRALRRRIGRVLGRYRMIADGDRIVVGLSGGKDSLLLLHALSDLRRRSPVRFDLAACTVALTRMDVSHLREYCTARNVPYTALEHPIMEIIESRAERSPCSFCANMRRGVLSSERSCDTSGGVSACTDLRCSSMSFVMMPCKVTPP